MENVPVQKTDVWKVSSAGNEKGTDLLAVEEPLEIRIAHGAAAHRKQENISITMRTPGHDNDLAMGFLFSEGIIKNIQEINAISHLPPSLPNSYKNIILVELREDIQVQLGQLERHFYTSSSCGVCGKTSIEAIQIQKTGCVPASKPLFRADLIHQLPTTLRKHQALFDNTGGLHAAALFDSSSNLLLVREDVGRHNAVDKLIGAALSKNMLPLHDYLILVSGRASFELVQKSMLAGIPVLAAVGAPSSLAVQLAQNNQMTILGFVRDNRFNIYCGEERIV